MFEPFLPILRETLRLGPQPAIVRWAGTLYHGTSATSAAQIIRPPGQLRMPDPDREESWKYLMVGPAIYAFVGAMPHPEAEPGWSDEEYGRRAARALAEYGRRAARALAEKKLAGGELSGSVAVVAFEVELERVLDLECAESGPFLDAMFARIGVKSHLLRYPPQLRAALLSPPFIGRMANAMLDEFPAGTAPQACRLRLPFADARQQGSLALFVEGSMLNTRLVG
ncbi:MAG TPA: hypothetical protein VGO11_11275 [Chthoniobacteraceae bacterium]|jgi:hypothetical protein|nr:hypothetical protein [Chthoniobacteraceae bacterium]